MSDNKDEIVSSYVNVKRSEKLEKLIAEYNKMLETENEDLSFSDGMELILKIRNEIYDIEHNITEELEDNKQEIVSDSIVIKENEEFIKSLFKTNEVTTITLSLSEVMNNIQEGKTKIKLILLEDLEDKKVKEILIEPNNEISVVKPLINKLREDDDYYRPWKDNIAMAFKDEYWRTYNKEGFSENELNEIHIIANNAANNFLKSLIA